MELITSKKLVWPVEVQEIEYLSKADNTLQSMYFYSPEGDKQVPLMVYLHPWSADYHRDDGSVYVRWCVENGWAIIIPDFRGPNVRPEACCSELVVADINSAVDYTLENAPVDPERIYLGGVSGGGHATLVMAGREPHRWAGVSAWVPVYDLAEWYEYCSKRTVGYTAQIENVCGGKPGDSCNVDNNYKVRSASYWIENAKVLPVELVGGIFDETIPPDHTLEAFNMLANPEDCFSREEIDYIVVNRKIPDHLQSQVKQKSVFGNSKILFERRSANVNLIMFDGGHEVISEALMDCLKQMNSDKKESGNR